MAQLASAKELLLHRAAIDQGTLRRLPCLPRPEIFEAFSFTPNILLSPLFILKYIYELSFFQAQCWILNLQRGLVVLKKGVHKRMLIMLIVTKFIEDFYTRGTILSASHILFNAYINSVVYVLFP